MILLETLARRWYAFGFIVFFFWAAAAAGGWRRALRFLVIAGAFSLGAELASTHGPFPYGRYAYVAPTRGDEIYLWNVPLFVPFSFGTVVWAGRSLALSALRPRSAFALVLGGAVMAAIADLVIDPMTLRGGSWFLGDLYRFEAGGYFGVPWSNFGGWLLVSAAIIATDHAFESRRRSPAAQEAARGTALAFGIMGFFLVIALATAEWAIAGAGGAITAGLGLQVLAAREQVSRARAGRTPGATKADSGISDAP